MTQLNDITDYMAIQLDNEVTLMELYEVFPFPKSSIRRVMGIFTKKGRGKDKEPLFERTSLGIYKLLEIYFKIAQTKTGHYAGDRQANGEPEIKIDATISGWIKKDKINFKTGKIDTAVRLNLNEKFIRIIIDLIEDYDSDFIEAMESDNTSFEIEGDEIRSNDFNYVQSTYDNSWTVEIIEVTIGEWSDTVAQDVEVRINESELY